MEILRVFSKWIKRKPPAQDPINVLVRSLQAEAWRFSQIEDRLEDPKFPFSGLYDPPPEVEAIIARILELSNVAVGRPIVTRELLTTVYQEKLSPPIFYNAWYRLHQAGAIPDTLKLGENVFLASAPTGSLYPLAYRESVSNKIAIVFDANLLLFTRIFLTSVVNLCFDVGKDAKPDDFSWVRWGENFTMDRTLQQVIDATAVTENIAALLLNTIVKSVPYSDNFTNITLGPKEDQLLALMIDDLFTFMIGHELGHIQAGYLDECKPEEVDANHDTTAKRERFADLHAFATLANTISQTAGNFRIYIHTSIIFHTMSFLYRAVHALRFGCDYGHLTPQTMFRLYFPSEDAYPHPLARLHSLRREVRANASTTPPTIDDWDSKIDSFFENLWKPVYLHLACAEVQIAPQWHYIVEAHRVAYAKAPT